MKSTAMITVFTTVLWTIAGLVILALAPGTASARVAASSERRPLHVTKECSEDDGTAGAYCTITASNFGAIRVGSRVYYDQPAGIPTGLLDSNVILDAGNGNRAIGRCTLDLTTALGLCTFQDGTGRFAGFHARVDVDCTSGCRWDGTYGFQDLDRDR